MVTAIGYLLDTNVIVAIIRGNDFGKRLDDVYALSSSISRSMISVVTIGEMLSLARQFNWGGPKRDKLQALLDEIVSIDINHPDILDSYAEIDHFSWQQGRKMGKNDIWAAATAAVSKATLLTTDKDFDHLHGKYVNRIWVDPDTK
jgi:predicted nucleic acid-binding protein